MVITVDGLFYTERKRIAGLALAPRLPKIVNSKETLEVGALIAYGPITSHCAGAQLRSSTKSSRGAKLTDLPVEQPTKF